MTHTPGPWAYAGYGRVNKDSDEWQFIAEAHEDADAVLISAAPYLLEALQQFVKEYVQLVERGDAGFWDAEEESKVIKARAAISKATHKPQEE